jgi:hypothetical protein
MSEEAKKYIQSVAWNRFPAQELWIRQDNSFWAFDIEDDHVVFTEGIYRDGDILFHSTSQPAEDGEALVDSFVEQKRQEGFECFAIQMRN